jgi:hypothetical protein
MVKGDGHASAVHVMVTLVGAPLVVQIKAVTDQSIDDLPGRN